MSSIDRSARTSPSLTLIAIVFVHAENLVDLASFVTRTLNVCPEQSLASWYLQDPLKL